MADQNSTWSALLASGDPVNSLKLMGLDALNSGQVDPKDAIASYNNDVHPVLKAAGLGGGPLQPKKKNKVPVQAPVAPIPDPNAQTNMPQPGTGGASYQVTPGDTPVAKGSGLSMSSKTTAQSEDTSKQDNGTKSTEQRLLMMGEPQYENAYSMAEKSPAIQKQEADLDNMRSMLSMEANAPSDVYSGPIAGLLQSEFHRNPQIMAAESGPSPDVTRQRLLAGLQKVTGDQGNISKTIADYIAKQKAGTSTLQQTADLVKAIKDTGGTATTATAVDPNKFIHNGPKPYDPSKDVEKLQKSQQGLQGVLDSFNVLDKQIGGVDNWKPGQDIPGMGLTAMVPNALLSGQGSANKEAFNDLKNQILKEFNGSRITAQENQRLNSALGSGVFSSDRDVVNALQRFRGELGDIMGQREAAFKGVHPQVLDLYKKGGGTLSTDIPKKSAPAAPDFNSMSNDDLKKYLGQ